MKITIDIERPEGFDINVLRQSIDTLTLKLGLLEIQNLQLNTVNLHNDGKDKRIEIQLTNKIEKLI